MEEEKKEQETSETLIQRLKEVGLDITHERFKEDL